MSKFNTPLSDKDFYEMELNSLTQRLAASEARVRRLEENMKWLTMAYDLVKMAYDALAERTDCTNLSTETSCTNVSTEGYISPADAAFMRKMNKRTEGDSGDASPTHDPK